MSTTSDNVTRTAWASMIQSALFSGSPLTTYKLSTINETLGILDGAELAGQIPKFGYWCIGDKGHVTKFDEKNNSFIDPLQHSRLDAACFNHVPFALKREGFDLPEELRKRFVLRREMELDGVMHYGYYGMRLPKPSGPQKLEIVTVINGVEDVQPFLEDSKYIYPSPTVVAPDRGQTTNRQYARITIPITVDFTEQDVNNLMEVATILYGNERQAIISEIACVTGIDREVTITTDGNQKSKFTEIVHAQTAAHIQTYQQMTFNRLGFTMELELGATEPLETGIELPMDIEGYKAFNVMSARIAERR